MKDTPQPKIHFTDVTHDPFAKLPPKFTRPWVYWVGGRAYAETKNLQMYRASRHKEITL